MNCLWLLVLLCCSRNRSGFNNAQSYCDANSNSYSRRDSARCNCDGRQEFAGYERERDSDYSRRCDCDNERLRDSDSDDDRRRDRDTDCGCERRSFISFGNQTCSCENNQNQS